MAEHPGALAGRVAIVTGATRNIGLATAEAFAAEGASIVVTSNERSHVAETVERLTASGEDVLGFTGDAASVDDMDRLADAALERFGRVDVVVNNALFVAKSSRRDDGDGALLGSSRALWDEGIDGYLHAPMRLLTRLVPHMAPGTGSIINVVSTAAFMPIAGLGVYGVTKAAMWAMTTYLAAELAPGIRVNALCPGTIVPEDEAPLAGMEQLLARVPMARTGRPWEVAQAAVFLASDASSYTTGQLLFVDGGRVALR